MDEETDWYEMPEETKQDIISKIDACAWSIRSDWSDPRGECRMISKLCEKLSRMMAKEALNG